MAAGDAGACQDARDPNLTDTLFPEPDVPALGAVFTFLVSFERNAAESGLGLSISGTARVPVTYCP